LVFAIDTRLDDGALGSFHDSWRVTQFLQWAAPPPLARVTPSFASPSRAWLAAGD
jgi:hypothetical protein